MIRIPFRRLSIEEINEAIALYLHLRNHEEVLSDRNLYQHKPMCKICNITAQEILNKKLYEVIIKKK